ncbi:hypothetical protein LINPERPRIM_LOCUS10203 [Linum perenne]
MELHSGGYHARGAHTGVANQRRPVPQRQAGGEALACGDNGQSGHVEDGRRGRDTRRDRGYNERRGSEEECVGYMCQAWRWVSYELS